MSIQFCQSFLLEQILGVHDLSTDVVKVALYSNNLLTDETTVYSTTNEASNGSGYTTGGQALTLSPGYPRIENKCGAVRYEQVNWTFALGKSVQQALLYNSSKGNKAIVVLSLSGDRTFLGEFSIQFPVAANPIIFNRAPMPSE